MLIDSVERYDCDYSEIKWNEEICLIERRGPGGEPTSLQKKEAGWWHVRLLPE
jgi:hypothetical protein